MKLTQILALVLSLALTACGQLPQEIADTFKPSATPDPNGRVSTFAVSSMTYDSAGAIDLHYLMSYNADLKAFVATVSRVHGSAIQKAVRISKTDSSLLYNALVSAFSSFVQISSSPTCNNCTSVSDAQIVRRDGTTITYHYPSLLLLDATRTVDLFEELNRFILNRL